jgi:alpha-D-xyloside xylohydrolase
MKFTDGYWMYREGVTPHFPVHVHDVEVGPESLTVYGATKRLNHRGDTLNLGLLTVRFSSPMPEVIRVQLMHHKGGAPAGPNFALHRHNPRRPCKWKIVKPLPASAAGT